MVSTRWIGVCFILAVMPGGDARAQAVSVLKGGSGGVAGAVKQSRIVELAATTERQCTSISSKSRRCHFTFATECKKRGAGKEHCTRMDGFCHACTDQYAFCKSDAAKAASKSAKPSDCGGCNAAYDRCIESMVKQYGGNLATVR